MSGRNERILIYNHVINIKSYTFSEVKELQKLRSYITNCLLAVSVNLMCMSTCCVCQLTVSVNIPRL